MSRVRARRPLLVLLAVALAAPPGALGGNPATGRGTPGLPRPSSHAAVTLDDPAPRALLVAYRSGTTGAARTAIRASHGLTLIRSVPRLNTDVVVPHARSISAAIADLSRDPAVVLAVPDRHRSLSADPSGEPLWRLQWGHHNVGQSVFASGGVADVDVDGLESLGQTVGSGSVVVAVIDDGVDFAHPELAASAWVNPGESGIDAGGLDRATNGIDDDLNGYVDDVHGWDFCNDDNSVHDFDQDWHGTAVAGVIAASIDGRGTAGLAPATSIMALKFLKNPEDEADPTNPACGWDSQAIAAMSYAASFGVRLTNASWGGNSADPLLERAIAESGALVVAAAGNDHRNIDVAPVYPAAYALANVLSVGAVDNTGAMASFSNWGMTSVDLVGPGQDILAPCPADALYADPGTCWTDGTSFAAPYAAAAGALIGSVQPTLLADPAAMRRRLLATGTPLAPAAGLTVSGNLLNARRAIDFVGPVLSGAPSVVPLGGSTLGAATVRARLAWPAATDDVATASYRVEHRVDAATWTIVSNASPATHLDVTLPLIGSDAFRITPRDASGNLGSPVAVVVSPTRFEQGTVRASVTGTWRTIDSAAASGGRTRYTTTSGGSMTFTFDGRAVALVAPRGRTRDSFKVYLDGRYVRTISLYSSTALNRQLAYTSGWLPAGRHTLRLVNAWTSGRTRGEVDAFIVLR